MRPDGCGGGRGNGDGIAIKVVVGSAVEMMVEFEVGWKHPHGEAWTHLKVQ